MTKEEEKTLLLDTKTQLLKMMRAVPAEAQPIIQPFIDKILENTTELLLSNVRRS